MKKIITLILTLLAIVPNVTGKEFLPIIEEGNEYEYVNNYSDVYNQHYTIYYILKIEGDSLYNERLYKKCKWDIKTINENTGEESYKSFTNGLVREENGKVWMIYDAQKENSWLPYSYGIPTVEFLIYNMNLEIDEDIVVVPENYSSQYYNRIISVYRNGKFRLVEKTQITIGEQERLVQKFAYELYEKFEKYTRTTEAIEGVGSFGSLLLFPYTKTEIAGDYSPPYLNVKRNAKGEVVYKREWYASTPTSANPQIHVIGGNGEIIIEGECDRWSVTDISGRRWNTLKVPAGLYIVTVDGIAHKVMV